MMTNDEIAQAKSAHPGVQLHLVQVGETEVIVRAPTRAEFRRFSEEVDRSKFAALENLCASCILAPDASGRAALFERQPGLVVPVGDYIAKLGGLVERAEGKAL